MSDSPIVESCANLRCVTCGGGSSVVLYEGRFYCVNLLSIKSLTLAGWEYKRIFEAAFTYTRGATHTLGQAEEEPFELERWAVRRLRGAVREKWVVVEPSSQTGMIRQTDSDVPEGEYDLRFVRHDKDIASAIQVRRLRTEEAEKLESYGYRSGKQAAAIKRVRRRLK